MLLRKHYYCIGIKEGHYNLVAKPQSKLVLRFSLIKDFYSLKCCNFTLVCTLVLSAASLSCTMTVENKEGHYDYLGYYYHLGHNLFGTILGG